MNNESDGFVSLDKINRSYITTREAAYYLNRRPQTLLSWASSGKGLLRPKRLYGRLAWSVEDIKKILE